MAAIRQSNDQQMADIVAAKKDLWENTSHSISNLWGRDSFYELTALSQYTTQVANKISAAELEANKLLALQKMVLSPYFARIDFRFEGEEQAEKVYIGRAALLDERKTYFHVYDWRSPLASVFYRFGLGEAYYDAPKGRINGEIGLKRQFEISRGELEYFFDAELQIMDEFLKKLLAQNASPQMKTIVETIQKDQDIIIRDMENDLLMVQGVAGSGKTSIALHRVAYLMYQGLADKLAAHNIIIISPHGLFARYIANVLPDLGEDNVATVTFDEMIAGLLDRENAQSKSQLWESLLTCTDGEERRLRQRALEFKTSSQFIEILERFIADIPHKWLQFKDVAYDGQIIVTAAGLKEKALASAAEPLLVRLKRLENFLWHEVHELRPARMQKLLELAAQQEEHVFETAEYARLLSIEESDALREQIQRFTSPNVFSLYQKLFSDWPYFLALAQGIDLPCNMEQIWQFCRENLPGEHLLYEDALALAFLRLRLNNFRQAKQIRQVVIDEAQDYYPMHFALLKMLFPQARHTVLGDMQQTIAKPADAGLFESIRDIFAMPQATLVTMNKSFRCTSQIFAFSQRFLPPGLTIETVSRAGEEPQIHAAPDQAALDELLIKEIQLCREANYQSIALLCKTEREAAALYARLQGRVELRLLDSGSGADIGGTIVLPIYLAKGLEFDAVLLYGVDREHYATEDDKQLLYIGCTRALHRLNLFYAGAESALLS